MHTVSLHPVAFAAWLVLFFTFLNLFPFGQLDGGHILHARSGTLQRRAAQVLWVVLIPLGALWWGW
jgi:Zn-dependent protease